MNDSNIPNDAGVAIEYNIPQTSKRVDFIVSGYDENNKANAVIIELKQWTQLDAVEGPQALVKTYTGHAKRMVVHPSYQAWSYSSMIKEYNENVQEKNIGLHPCVYLHNYELKENDPIEAPQYQEYIEEAPLYTYGHVLELQNFIKNFIKSGDSSSVIYEIEMGKIRPSKSLQDSIGSMLNGNREFAMIDEQKVAYEEILEYSKMCVTDTKKRTIIVEGGPGTGKSVIAINLLAALTQKELFVQYVSKNSAPRSVYQRKLKGAVKKSSVDIMFKGSGIYTEAPLNAVHTILVDEAHRLNAKSGMFKNLGENQIKEIIHAARCSVFFIDESQRVTLSDIGSVQEIEKWAYSEGSEIHKLVLESQFRCNGSNGYLAWLDNVLEIRRTANYDLEDIDYDVKVLDSPMAVYDVIKAKNDINHRSRMLAGYCWEWKKQEQDNSKYHDIEIGGFSMSWNLGNDIFALSDTSINEVGCIHTSQGLEFDYVGVIIGDDMRYENGHIVTDFTKRAKTDQSLKGIKKLYRENPKDALEKADEIIKNTYRTLMTRGMKGCYIYCTDKGLENYLRECIENSQK